MINIPRVEIEVAADIMSNSTSVHVEIYSGVSDYLWAYIRALLQGTTGLIMSPNVNLHIKSIIDNKLYGLAQEGRLFKDIDGTWDVDGFLWVPNEY